MSTAERNVKKLARLPSNTICPNCETSKKFGFNTVCIKYHTFVCNNCKSSHQAISHRCKSLTMSSWSDQEVVELQKKGNEYARRSWLKNAPPVGQNGRPKEGDHIDVFKRFVVDVYERKLYYDDDEGCPPTPSSTNVAVAIPISERSKPKVSKKVERVRNVHRELSLTPNVPPVADLLDFTSTPSESIQPAVNGSSAFQTDFDDIFAPVKKPAEPATQHVSFPALSASSGFNFIDNHAQLSSKATSTATTTPFKKSIMSNHSMSEKSSTISSMNLPVSTVGNFGTNNGSMGWKNFNNSGSFQSGMPNNVQQMGNIGMMQNQEMLRMMQQQQQMNPMFANMASNALGTAMMTNSINNKMINMNVNLNTMDNRYNNSNNNSMMNQQRNNSNNVSINSKESLDSLQMNVSSMHAWSSGVNK